MIIGRFDAAKVEFEQGARLDPTSAEMPYNLGKLYSIQDNWADARKSFEAAVRLNPRYMEAHDGLGFALEALHDDAGAIASYQKAIELNEASHAGFASPYVNLSALYNRNGDREATMKYARKALEVNERSDRALFQLAKACERDEDLTCAAESLNRAIAINPRASSYFYVLATVLRKLGKADESRKAMAAFSKLERETNELDQRRRDGPGRKIVAHRRPVPRPWRMSRPRRGQSSRRRFLQVAGLAAFARPLVRGAQPSGPRFTDITTAAGLGTARNTSGSAPNKQFLLEEMGCGVAIFDYDNDGWLDIFLVNGTTSDRPPRPQANQLSLPQQSRRHVHGRHPQGRPDSFGMGPGGCVGDYDNDGFDDLFVTYFGRNVLYHNNGDGTFTDVSEQAGVAGVKRPLGRGLLFPRLRPRRPSRSVRRQLRDLRSRRARRKPGDSAYCRYNEIPVPCGPQGFGGGTNLLYRNRGDGTFEDVSEKSGIGNPRGSSIAAFVPQDWRPTGSYGMGAAAADFDNDGWPDIYVACDTAPSLLYRNNHDGTFREVAVPAGCAFDENGVALSGMGVGVADYDGDGWLDIVRTNFSDQVTTLYRNNGDGTFHDASMQAGLGVNRKYLGFGVGFFDFDNDGWKDIFIANGHVYSADRRPQAPRHL